MSVPDELFSMALQKGFTTEGACALLANVQAESAFDPCNLEDTYNLAFGLSDMEYTNMVDNGSYTRFASDSAGYGLAQWTWGPRKKELLSYARERGTSIGNLQMQKDFIFKEMKESYPGCWNLCVSSHDLYAITQKLLYEWENPLEKEKAMTTRYSFAQSWYRQYKDVNPESLPVNQDNTAKEKTGMTQEEAVQKVLDLARSEIGTHEQGDNWTKYAEEMDRTNWYNGPKNGFPWCDLWYDWLLYKSFGDPLGREMICQPTGSAGAGCLYSAQYYKGAGRWHTTDPQPGDQIFFTYSPGEYSHTGIVEKVSGGTVTTIEGNTSDQVARRQYSVGSSVIAGYGRPKWELAAGSSGGGSTPSPSPTPRPSQGNLPEGFSRILKKGMKGTDVYDMQRMLEDLGYDLGPDGADGDFGNNTANAVRAFQMAEGLEIDGQAGQDTLNRLVELACFSLNRLVDLAYSQEDPEPEPELETPEVPTPLKALQLNDKGYQVTLAQAALNSWGYNALMTGIFSGEFEKKIREFQTANGLESDGIIGSETWKKLLDLPIA